MKTAIVGIGNLGWNLALGFQSVGVPIDYLITRNQEKASVLSKEFPESNCLDGSFVPVDVELLFLCLPDDQLATFANQIGNHECAIVHCSGNTLDLNLSNQKTGVFYPFQTFTIGRSINWPETPIFIESKDKILRAYLHELASRLSDRVNEINSDQRQALHIAGVFGANFNNHLIQLISEILIEAELPFELAKPLIQETVSKAFDLTPIKAQTGPAIRGDKNVVADHLKRLEKHPKLVDFYKLFTQSIQNH